MACYNCVLGVKCVMCASKREKDKVNNSVKSSINGAADYTIQDSGKREEMSTGAQRDSREGKGRFDLLWPFAIPELAIHLEKGADKYDARNWEKGIKVSRSVDSALRHAFEYMAGLTDENHLVAAAWNLLTALDTRARVARGLLPKELDDMPPQSVKTIPEKIKEVMGTPEEMHSHFHVHAGCEDTPHTHLHRHTSDRDPYRDHTHVHTTVS